MLLSYLNLSAQSNYLASLNGIRGFMMQNAVEGKYSLDSRNSGFGLYFGKQTNKTDSWATPFRYPDYGLGFMVNFPDKSNILGNSYSMFITCNIPVINTQSVSFLYTISLGSSFVSKPFNADNNYLNHANGSYFNALANFGLSARVKVNKSILWNTGLSFYHISNGNISLPNDGQNLIAVSSGILYSFSSLKKKEKGKFTLSTKQNFLMSTSIGTRQTKILGNNYLIYKIEAEYYPLHLEKRKIGLGIDYVIDKTYDYYFATDTTGKYSIHKYSYSGIYAVHILNLNRFNVVTATGFYIDYNNIVKENLFYHIGVRYFLNKNVFGTFSLKAKLSGVDFISWGVGYSI